MKPRLRRLLLRRLLLSAGLAVSMFPGLPFAASAQGCSQCREAVGQTPPRTQAAYRAAIVVMVTGGASVFGVGILLLRRYR